jgi:hypothetical protein
MLGLFPSFRAKPKLGEKCQPGDAREGSICDFIESKIQKRLQEKPDNADLRSMEAYIMSLEVVANSGQTLDLYYLSDCIEHYKPQGSIAGLSAGSRTSPSDAGSSHTRSDPASSIPDSAMAVDDTVRRDPITHPLTTK